MEEKDAGIRRVFATSVTHPVVRLTKQQSVAGSEGVWMRRPYAGVTGQHGHAETPQASPMGFRLHRHCLWGAASGVENIHMSFTYKYKCAYKRKYTPR